MQWIGRILIIIFVLLVHSLSAQRDSTEFKSLSGKNLNQALKILSRDNFKFAYDPQAVSEIQIGVLPELNSIDDFLSHVLLSSNYWYKKVEDTWLIYPKESEIPTQFNFSVNGVVSDIKTGEVLPFASVGIKGSNIGTTTNTDGKFTLLKIPSDTSTLVFSYLGYQELELRLDPQLSLNTLDIQLIHDEKFLPSVEIYGQNLKIIDANKNISQITLNPARISKLPNLGEVDLFSAMRLLPGINASEESSSGLKIRGGNTDENLVLFDGFTVYHVDHFFGVYSAFNTNVVKNVQIFKGGYQAKYGGRTSGVISITGIDGNNTKPSGSFEINPLSANVLLELPLVKDKASLVVAYRRAFTNILQSPSYKKIFNNLFSARVSAPDSEFEDAFSNHTDPDFYFYDSNVKVNFKPTDKDAISLSFYKGEDNLDINFDLDNSQLTLNSFDQSNWGNTGGSIKWSRQWNKKYFTYLILGKSLYKSSLVAEETAYNAGELFYRGYFNQKTALHDITFRFNNEWQISENHNIEFGLWHTDISIAMQAEDQQFIYSDSLQESSSTAIYLQNTSQLGQALTLTYGLRGNQISNTGSTFLEPRINASLNLSENVKFKAAYGIFHQNIRRLNQQSLYLSIPETWALSNDKNIPVLRSDHYIAGVTYEKNNFLLNSEVFYKKEKGNIDFIFPELGYSTGNIDQYAVNGEKWITGWELLLQKRVNDHSGLISYTLSDMQSKYNGYNSNQNFPAFNDVTHEVKAVYTFEYNRWDFSASFIYATGKPYTPVYGTYVITRADGESQQLVSLGDVNSARLPDYHRLDIAVNYSIPLKNGVLETGFSLYNAYNHLNIKFIDYYQIPQENGGEFTLGRRSVKTLGITPSLFLRLKL